MKIQTNARIELIKEKLRRHPNGVLVSQLAKEVEIKRTLLLYYLRKHLASQVEKTGEKSQHYPIRLKKRFSLSKTKDVDVFRENSRNLGPSDNSEEKKSSPYLSITRSSSISNKNKRGLK